MKTIAFFNNKGGVGTTSLVYHLAWMYSALGLRVLAADLDPQANLTTMFLDDRRLDSLWAGRLDWTILGSLRPLLEGTGGILDPSIEDVAGVGLLAGNLALAGFEDEISQQWGSCLEKTGRPFEVTGAFHEILSRSAQEREADIVLVDLGFSLGAIERAALIAADSIVIPLGLDRSSMQALAILGPRLREWREGWQQRLKLRPHGLVLPLGALVPLGYVVMQRPSHPGGSMDQHEFRARLAYSQDVLGEASPSTGMITGPDPHRIFTLKPYRSLMPLAQEARKPMFALKSADGAIGGHAQAVQDCYRDFQALAREVARRAGIELP